MTSFNAPASPSIYLNPNTLNPNRSINPITTKDHIMFIITDSNSDAVAPSTPRPRRRLVIGLIAAGMFLAACGSDDEAATPAASDDAPAAVAEEEAAAETADISNSTGAISTGSTDAGDVLIDEDSLSLYGFLPDEGGAPTCGGGCAQAWPPVLVPSADLPEGLDSSIFSVVEGLEGGFHLSANDWPLYRFAGDAAAGDITGQGSGDNWFLIAPDGSLITGEAAAPAGDVAETSDGYGY